MTDDRKTLKSIAQGFRGRTLKTARMATKVGFKALKKTLRPDATPADDKRAEAEIYAAANTLLDEMNELKGLMMKFGQMASYLEGALPPQAQQVLSRLQDQSTPMEADAVAAVVTEQLGSPPEEAFDTFERQPFAAASIGQVHKATLGGQQLAVKVQYPGIQRALASDLKTMSVLGRLSTTLMPVSGKDLVNELRDRMLEECDYEAEARNQQLFQGLLSGFEGASVPSVRADRSTGRVLTTEFMPGSAFYAFCESAPPEVRDRAATLIFDVCFTCIFHHCVFNADPHPGNYLFAPDGDVVFLDYGCIKHFDTDFVDGWKRLALAVLNDDKPSFRDAMIGTGMVMRPRSFDFDYQWDVMEYLYTPFKSKEPFTYTNEYVKKSYDLMMWKNPNKLRTGMPPDWLFLNRLQWGLNSVLAHMKATGPWPRIWRAAVESRTAPVVQSGGA